MKNAIILHGTGDSADNFWFPYVKKELESRGYDVWLPNLPCAEKPNIKDWLSFVLESGKITEETVLIGHSAGAQIILSVLENLNIKIKQAILVSGYSKELPKDVNSEMNKYEFNWESIRPHAGKFAFVNSDNDPWGCDDKQGRIMFDHLGGMQIILHEGHMGSNKFNQPYKEFPLIVKLVELGEI
ncbi:TPA: alpha/beta hydrolase [Candidatus Berkelbacteria bacterium]|uniref:Putative Alpha/beta fold family hydrolase n=1 Tax=Berkelbacteria bacterium GW2011_GWE1_39_12 TaxID=1618337 RepID=A0A0G4B3F0_9BACT|nr:MAG: putative Alpha/beta fold family hydrolase [Berkelbacteria bacterium GW2011_GWE1_39_12]HBO60959.1 alpha/beta hydrolase [Candidatus Berkelbacteria bacterium]